jgi:DNA-binding NarL/FixJ family response regulator
MNKYIWPVLDLGMPGMNGFEAARILHKTKPQVPLFMFTSHDTHKVESQAASAGIRAVFSVDFEMAALPTAIEVLLQTDNCVYSAEKGRCGVVL